jgi:hypothetical protein
MTSKRTDSPTNQASAPFLFSALVEIVGIQDVAEEDVGKFTQRTNHFRNRLDEVRAAPEFKNREIEIRKWLDRCYLQCPSATWLLHYINSLRSLLLNGDEPVFIRTVVNQGRAFDKGDVFKENSALLADQLMKFKSVGILVTESVRDATLREQAAEKMTIVRTFQNCYMTGEGSKQKSQPYWDLSWNPYPSGFVKFEMILAEIKETIHRSKKSGKYFCPILINFARHLMPNEKTIVLDASRNKTGIKRRNVYQVGGGKVPDGGFHRTDLLTWFFHYITTEDGFQLLKTIPGGDLVLFTLMDRRYSSDPASNGMFVAQDTPKREVPTRNAFNSSYDCYLEHWIYGSAFLQAHLEKGHARGLPPTFILSGNNRGIVRKRMTAAMAKKSKEKKVPTSTEGTDNEAPEV